MKVYVKSGLVLLAFVVLAMSGCAIHHYYGVSGSLDIPHHGQKDHK
jgi:hypothetical protein